MDIVVEKPLSPEQMLGALSATETVLRMYGWCKLISINRVGHHCFGYALDMGLKTVLPLPLPSWEAWCAKPNSFWQEERERFYDLLVQDPLVMERTKDRMNQHSESPSVIVWFNDHKDTTEEEVFALIERTKKRLQ